MKTLKVAAKIRRLGSDQTPLGMLRVKKEKMYIINRRSEDTNRQKDVNGKPEGFRVKK